MLLVRSDVAFFSIAGKSQEEWENELNSELNSIKNQKYRIYLWKGIETKILLSIESEQQTTEKRKKKRKKNERKERHYV